MAQQQVRSDIRESRIGIYRQPDDWRKVGGSAHLTDPRGREHRDRGMTHDSPEWREHQRRFRD